MFYKLTSATKSKSAPELRKKTSNTKTTRRTKSLYDLHDKKVSVNITDKKLNKIDLGALAKKLELPEESEYVSKRTIPENPTQIYFADLMQCDPGDSLAYLDLGKNNIKKTKPFVDKYFLCETKMLQLVTSKNVIEMQDLLYSLMKTFEYLFDSVLSNLLDISKIEKKLYKQLLNYLGFAMDEIINIVHLKHESADLTQAKKNIRDLAQAFARLHPRAINQVLSLNEYGNRKISIGMITDIQSRRSYLLTRETMPKQDSNKSKFSMLLDEYVATLNALFRRSMHVIETKVAHKQLMTQFKELINDQTEVEKYYSHQVLADQLSRKIKEKYNSARGLEKTVANTLLSTLKECMMEQHHYENKTSCVAIFANGIDNISTIFIHKTAMRACLNSIDTDDLITQDAHKKAIGLNEYALKAIFQSCIEALTSRSVHHDMTILKRVNVA